MRVSVVAVTDAEALRDQVWSDYFYERRNKICSRCGNYHRYTITETQTPVSKEVSDYFHLDFHETVYEIKTVTIHNKDSNDSEWGNLCSKCRQHVLGIAPNPLDSSLARAESELAELKQKERERRMFQADEIKAAKERRRKENGGNGNTNNGQNHKRVRATHQLNPNDLRLNKGERENWRAEK